MQYRSFGKTGWQVSEIGYGAWGIGGEMWKGSRDNESLQSLHRAIELGLNFIDTAAAYGEGHSEKLVGQVYRERRPERPLYIATKVAPKNSQWPALPDIPYRKVFSKDYIISSTEKSLRRLGIERIHLQQLHVWRDEFTVEDDWKEAAQQLKSQGKIERFGISINDHEPASVLKVMESGLIDVFQVIYNIFDQTPEDQLFPACQARQIAIIARCPFDEGSLTGTITPDTTFASGDFRAAYFKGDRKRQVFERITALKKDFEGYKKGLPDLALRFCLHTPAVSTVIPGMRKLAHAEANCAAADGPTLSGEQLAMLRRHAWTKNFYSD